MSFLRTLLHLDKSVLRQHDFKAFMAFKEKLLDEQKVQIATPRLRAEEKLDVAAQALAQKQIIEELVQAGWKTKVCHTLLFQLNQAEQLSWQDVIMFEVSLVEECLQFRQLILDCYIKVAASESAATAEPLQDVIYLLLKQMKLKEAELILLEKNIAALQTVYQSKGLFGFVLTFIEGGIASIRNKDAKLQEAEKAQELEFAKAIAANVPLVEARRQQEKRLAQAEAQKERTQRGAGSALSMAEQKEKDKNLKKRIFDMYVTLGRNEHDISVLQDFCAECNAYQATLEKYLQVEAKEVFAKYFGGKFARNSEELFCNLVVDLSNEKLFSSMPHIKMVLVNYQNVLMLHRHALSCHKSAEDRLNTIKVLLAEKSDALEFQVDILACDHEIDRCKRQFVKKVNQFLFQAENSQILRASSAEVKSSPLDKLRELAQAGVQQMQRLRAASAADAAVKPQTPPMFSSMGAMLQKFKSSRTLALVSPVPTLPSNGSPSGRSARALLSKFSSFCSVESVASPKDAGSSVIKLTMDVNEKNEVKLSIGFKG